MRLPYLPGMAGMFVLSFLFATFVTSAAAGEKKPTTHAQAVISRWGHYAAAHIARDMNYPDTARRQGLQGQVLVRLDIDRSGNILDANVVQSSGSDILDAAALETVKKSSPLPAPPLEAEGTKLSLQIPIVFVLDRSGWIAAPPTCPAQTKGKGVGLTERRC